MIDLEPRAENTLPKIGIFYFYNDRMIVPKEYQKEIDPVTRDIQENAALNNPGEHRDLWDDFMVVRYPELKKLYDDNHKLLPRGRVGFHYRKDTIRFLITLDKCIKGREDEIIGIYNLSGYDVEFSYGALNYKCRDC